MESDDLALALELADAADSITLSRFGARDLVVETKVDLTPVSEADVGAERAIRDRLSAVRPDDVVLGEELGGVDSDPADSDPVHPARRWIIDPIDGTKNYVRGIPVWATLLALEHRGEVTVAVVSAPALGRRWWSVRGAGAFMRDAVVDGGLRRLRVSGVRDLGEAQLSFAGLEDWREIDRLDAILALAERCGRTRGLGDFWAYMLVAEGAIEIGLDPAVSLWDLAAPQLIVEEAGGRFTDLGGTRTPAGGDAIATNALLHEAALAFVGRSGVA
jgi:histidinol-phosphatase